ncbi:MAG: hypothetical protein ACFCBU_04900 [Cyanophyceae cyanobacterium]
MKVRLVSSLSALVAGSLLLFGGWMIDNHERDRHVFSRKTSAKDHLNFIHAQIGVAIQQEVQISKGIANYIIRNPDLTAEGFKDIAKVWLSPRGSEVPTVFGHWENSESINQVTLLRPGAAPYKSRDLSEVPLTGENNGSDFNSGSLSQASSAVPPEPQGAGISTEANSNVDQTGQATVSGEGRS